jgi:hypothetical protein
MIDIAPPVGYKSVWQDIADRADELKAREYIQKHAPAHIRESLLNSANKPGYRNADGIFFQDTKTPFITADDASVTLSTTSLLLHTIQYTSLPANYFSMPGKMLQLWMLGRMTTAATPGNITVELRFGTASNAGTILATTAAIAAGASKTNITWVANFFVRCRAIGATGSLFGWGWFAPEPSSVVFPAANNPAFAPATAPAATTVDTTAASGINVQMKRSGSTAETAQVHDLVFAALN